MTKYKYFLLMTGSGEWYTGIHTIEEARGKARELGGGVEIFEHVETTPFGNDDSPEMPAAQPIPVKPNRDDN